MGSLLPGWNALPEDQEATPGSLRRTSVDQVPRWLKSLRESGSSVATHSAVLSPRPSGSPRTGGSSQEANAVAQKRLSLKRTSLPVELVQGKDTHHNSLMSDRINWWRMIDSGSFNTPGTDMPADYKKGAYQPQYDAAQVHKHAAAGANVEQPNKPAEPEDSYASDTTMDADAARGVGASEVDSAADKAVKQTDSAGDEAVKDLADADHAGAPTDTNSAPISSQEQTADAEKGTASN